MSDDKELTARLRDWEEHDEGKINDAREEAAARIEALVKEKEQLGREVNMARYGQPDFAWSIHKEAMADLEAKLAKAVAFLEEIALTGDWFTSDMNDLIKELKGESHD